MDQIKSNMISRKRLFDVRKRKKEGDVPSDIELIILVKTRQRYDISLNPHL